MEQNGCPMTQSTLSRDLRELNVSKIVLQGGVYRYVLPQSQQNVAQADEKGFVSIAFSGNIAVVKTRPGYASRLAYEIDEKAADVVIGTVAGEDTILLVTDEKSTREQVLNSLSVIIKLK
jgi:transcriptional regulator of arginine metabolism